MNGNMRTLAKRILPSSFLHLVRGYRNRGSVAAADVAAAWEFKRAFFWNAFRALDFNGIDGDYAEFGCWSGMTFRLAFDQIHQRKIRRHMWAFDSFQGLPSSTDPKDSQPNWKRGAMSTDVDAFHGICRAHGIPREAYTTVEGFYAQTLSQMPENASPTNIAVAYIDCDMYSSTKTVLKFLRSRLKHGMIIAFDDYFCWSASQISGEKAALLEALENESRWRFVRYRDYGWAGTSFVIERAVLSSPQGRLS